MCQGAVKIPDSVFYDTHMRETLSVQMVKKIIALLYYLH